MARVGLLLCTMALLGCDDPAPAGARGAPTRIAPTEPGPTEPGPIEAVPTEPSVVAIAPEIEWTPTHCRRPAASSCRLAPEVAGGRRQWLQECAVWPVRDFCRPQTEERRHGILEVASEDRPGRVISLRDGRAFRVGTSLVILRSVRDMSAAGCARWAGDEIEILGMGEGGAWLRLFAARAFGTHLFVSRDANGLLLEREPMERRGVRGACTAVRLTRTGTGALAEGHDAECNPSERARAEPVCHLEQAQPDDDPLAGLEGL